jgi:hypothetical protein
LHPSHYLVSGIGAIATPSCIGTKYICLELQNVDGRLKQILCEIKAYGQKPCGSSHMDTAMKSKDFPI